MRFVPEAFKLLKNKYTLNNFSKDIIAGVIVGIVAMPLAIAFAIASGLKPEQGLVTAIIAGFIISILSGSKVQIGGPTGAFIVIIFGIVQQYGFSGLAISTIMAGGFLILMGLAGMGSVIKFIPYPMTVGFTSGIAVIIAGGQIKDFLGLPTESNSGHFILKMMDYINDLGAINPATAGIGILSLFIIIVWQKYNKTLPGSIVAIFVSTLLVHFCHLDVATIGSRFGELNSTIPFPAMPEIHMAMLPQLIRPAITIAFLGAIESLLSAVVADGMIGTRHNSNMELIAQGVANIVSPLFGGLPATGAIARTATNIKNGGSSPISGIVHAITLLCLLLFFGKWASLIPLSTLAAVLLVVAYHMSEWQHFVKLFSTPKSDVLVLLTTFFLTIVFDLTIAIEVGVVLSAILFMKRMADVTQFDNITSDISTYDPNDFRGVKKEDIPFGVVIFEIHGPFFFGAANKFKDTLSIVKQNPQVLILRMRHVLTIDATALQAFEDMLNKTIKDKTIVLLSGVKPGLKNILAHSDLISKVGEENIFSSIELALERARQLVHE